MKVWGASFFVAAIAALIKEKVECIEISASEISPHETKSTNSSLFQGETKFDESLKNFFKQNNKNEEEIERDNFFDENKNFIRGEILSDMNSKFLVDVINNSTLNFLENLNADNEGENKDYQIELEENCSPFYCEKIMKAKEIERMDDTTNMSDKINDNNMNDINDNNMNDINDNNTNDNVMNFESSMEEKQNINENERNIKLHDNNNNNSNNNVDNNLVRNMNIIQEFYNYDDDSSNNNSYNSDDGVDALYLQSVEDGNDKQRIVLTDGNNVYVLEEITQNDNKNSTMNKDENDINKITNVEQEIKMHIPSDEKYNEDNLLENFMDYLNFEDSLLNNIDDVMNIQTDRETAIHPHNNTNDNHNDNNNKENSYYDNSHDSNIQNKEQNKDQSFFDDNIFNLSEEELSKKIFDDIKMNSEDKIECHNFSDNEDKCNSFKKCTYVNIDNKDTCFLDYNYMLFLKNNNCALQSKSSLLSISKDLLKNDIISRQMFQLLRNSNNNNFICDTVTYSFLTNVVDNTNYEEIFS
ncbi:conserved Plasmodium protein, unknown function [Plasmodium sp. gorilla clade G2]|uniref:conserved Plasmodium protein, unknown function n=1 Tax=Plasmodium sp. gorilla clade G2 TaxID=880535 RepID=UPI000D223DF9|nr:conserved Plasmodium protein, unknown function [Plasmodium sp. gorilla clade G2]SOV13055.1 conserved Plasmodium protein, unknown function [Plasmodium sp. gorilla clade G2]